LLKGDTAGERVLEENICIQRALKRFTRHEAAGWYERGGGLPAVSRKTDYLVTVLSQEQAGRAHELAWPLLMSLHFWSAAVTIMTAPIGGSPAGAAAKSHCLKGVRRVELAKPT